MASYKFDGTVNYPRQIITKLFLLISFIVFSNLSFANMPDYYSEPGLNPFRDNNNQQEYENVDPFTGKLQLHHTDAFIPGNGGLDLKVIRSYTSMNHPAGSVWSDSWSMHFGYVFRKGTNAICTIGLQISNTNNPVLVLPDGQSQVLSDADGGSGFITSQFWKATCAAGGNGLIVTSPEGTVYEMTYDASTTSQKLYYVQRITDKNGNWISISYNNLNANGAKITSVSTSDGRSLNYTYITDSFGYQRLSSIAGPFGTLSYSYTQLTSGGQNVVGAYLLTQVTRPDGLFWQYGYKADSTGPGSNEINFVRNPAGGTINYTYGTASFYFGGVGYIPDEVIASKAIAGLGTWSYAYVPSTGIGVMDVTTVSGPVRTDTYRHFGYNSVSNVGETWKIGLLQSKSTGSDQTETYSWNPILVSQHNNARIFTWVTKVDNEIYAPALSSKSIARDGATFTTTYSGFDTYGNPSTINETGSASRTVTRTYNVNTAKWVLHQLASENIGGFVTSYGYDGNTNLTSQNKYGVITSFGRTPAGDISSITDARSKQKTLSNYFRGIPQAETLPDAGTISRVVNSTGTIASETDGVSATVGYSYDTLNRPTFINRPLGNDVSISWGATSRTLVRGNFQEVTSYDAHARPTGVSRTDTTTGTVISTTMVHDALGRKTFESLPGSGSGTSYTYDALGRVKTVTFANSTTNNYTYSGSNVIFTNERGLSYTYGYRIYGNPDDKQLMSVAAPVATANITISRNAIGQPTAITQNGITRNYGYDTKAFLTSEVNPETGTTTYGRDLVGNMTTLKVGASGTTTYTYENMNRVSAITYPVPATTPGVSFTYDKVGQVLNSVAGPVTRVSVYDANRNLTSETQTIDGRSYQANYSYNANDVLSGITYPSGQIITYTLDAFGRQTSAAPYASAVSYHPSSQPSSITLANGVVTNYSYQARYWPATMAVSKGATPLISSTYSYDNNGNLSNIADTVVPAYNRALTFDGIDRLTGANGVWGTGTIAYNGQGNITSQLYGTYGLTHNYDAQNRLSTVTGSKAYSMAYDAYGNVTNNGTTTFQYDDASNMRCTNCALSTKAQYNYSADKMRSKKLVGTTATYYFYGLNGSLLGEYIPATQVQKEYFYLGAKLLAEREKTKLPVPNISYYHNDVVGSPLAATDKVGALKWREHYWPYGERNLRDTKAATATMWFAGKPQDADSKLSYFGARYYDPLLGRFMGIDPVGVDESNLHSHNRYAYGNNNPYKFVDPTGNIAETALDVVSLGLSIAQYNQNPSLLNGLGLAYDIVGTAVPILPAGFGIIRSAGNAADTAKAVHGNSKLSEKAQHVYEIRNVDTGEIVKTGISSGKIGVNGKSARAERQVRKWAKEKDEFGNLKCANCESTIIGEIPAGAGARQRALDIESSNAQGLRDAGQLKNRNLHDRP